MDALTDLAHQLVAKHGVDRYPTVNDSLHKLHEEVGEVTRAFLRGEDLAPELADVEISLRLLAHKAGVDLDAAVYQKVASDDRTFA